MSEAFEKWKVKYLKDNFMCEIGWVEGSKESIASKMSRAAYKAGQNQRDEEVNDLKRKLFLEGVKNNSRVARVEFLEDKLKALEVET